MNLKITLVTLCSTLAMSLFSNAEPLSVGSPAPEVQAVDQDGKSVNFKDVYAKGPTLVYFYPKSDTPGCTKQGCSLRDSWSELTSKGIQVLGVSADPVTAQKSFQDKYKLPFPIISDADFKVADAFGASHRSRVSFLVKDGKIAWIMPKASTETHAADVLKAHASLQK